MQASSKLFQSGGNSVPVIKAAWILDSLIPRAVTFQLFFLFLTRCLPFQSIDFQISDDYGDPSYIGDIFSSIPAIIATIVLEITGGLRLQVITTKKGIKRHRVHSLFTLVLKWRWDFHNAEKEPSWWWLMKRPPGSSCPNLKPNCFIRVIYGWYVRANGGRSSIVALSLSPGYDQGS